MTDDIRHTLCHKSGKLLVWCFNRLRIQTLPIIRRIVGSQENMKRQNAAWCVCGVWLALELVHIGFQMKRGFFGLITLTLKLVRMHVRVRIHVRVTGGVLQGGLTYVGRLSEQPHWRWPNQGAAVAKQGALAS